MMKLYRIIFWLVVASTLSGNLFSQKYSRIVSLAPSLTKSVYFLQSGNSLIGCTNFCEIESGEEKEIIATAIKVNLEKLVSLNADLIIATTITNPETIASLRKFGIRVEVFSSPKSFDEICRQFLQLGELLGKQELASSIVLDERTKVKSLSELQKNESLPDVFFQIGAKPLFTVIPNTYMDDLIRFSGCSNIANDMNRGTISRESILARNPDIIFIVTMGIIGEEEKNTWESYTDLKASKNDKIYIIDSKLACTPTPITFTQTLEIMINCINNNTME